MMVHSFEITKPGQVFRFQVRLPRNARQVVAIDYDVFFKDTAKRSSGLVEAQAVPGEAVIPDKIPTAPNIKKLLEQPPPEIRKPMPIDFLGNRNTNPVLGLLKLQSLEKANIFYVEWLKAFEWNIGIGRMGIFPVNPYTLLKKQNPKRLEVVPQTTILNGLYEDSLMIDTKGEYTYTIKIMVWLEMNEESKGVDFEFLKIKS